MKTILSSVPSFNEEDFPKFIEESRRIFQSGKFILGDNTEKLENEFKKYTKANYAIATSSATASLEIILKFINVENCEVIVPANTFVSTLYALENCKAKPVVVDIDPNTFCIDLEEVISNITSKTKALVITHIAGLIPEYISEIKEVCDKHDIFLIEDCAHATGAKYNGVSAGTFGFAGIFSLYQSKVISSGTGAVIITDNKELYEFSLLMRWHGVKGADNIHLASNWLLSEFNALVAYLQMCRIDEILTQRISIARSYIKELTKISRDFQFQKTSSSHIHSYYKFIVKYKDKDSISYITKELQSKGIQTGQCYPILLNEHSSIEGSALYKEIKPKAREFAESHFTIPLNLNLTEQDYEYVISNIKSLCTNTYA
ncbi:DegT/DnrJ/EryC1/StrS family aminotransferase [Bacillus infantis]|uniref:DegT/DnrJ/EryC1/StrS family aminotransferase n=1 Tax=Bacillus infantis TaxID=324767 RepID=UPI00209D3BC8|nr:DegT/DnrJ/EryC1/StrS family aminotransferase [Bacillus infantis]MCP1161329.1 DegT/DnrJ/EryC1/StrS family aminotransferase [Bacillus infantis]